VGGYGTILTSPDGITWTMRSSGTDYFLGGVTYGADTFVAVGDNGGWGTILTSPDGIIWTMRSSETTELLSGVTYGAGTFVAVGAYGTILQSDPEGTELQCSTWSDVISKYQSYVSGQASWMDVITCYQEYVS
jgi:hypothetical protein